MPEFNITVNDRQEQPNVTGDSMKNRILAPARLGNGDRYSGVAPYSDKLTLDKVREDL
jgi:hypothetical protein